MKTLSFLTLGLFLTIGIISCADNDHRYIDLETGKRIDVVKDDANGEMINAETKQPVVIYVDTQTKDTIYGRSGKVINNHVIKTDDGKYKYVSNDNEQVKIKSDEDGDYKRKVEKDGDVKIKDGDTKIKIDGKTGEKTIKKD